jgi:hypothetical protein
MGISRKFKTKSDPFCPHQPEIAILGKLDIPLGNVRLSMAG